MRARISRCSPNTDNDNRVIGNVNDWTCDDPCSTQRQVARRASDPNGPVHAFGHRSLADDYQRTGLCSVDLRLEQLSAPPIRRESVTVE